MYSSLTLDSARKNPFDSKNIWYLVGGAVVVFVGAAILTARSANAATMPPDLTPPPPPPPAPNRTTRPAAPTMVRQADGFDPSTSSATRVLQQQLKTMGFNIPVVDGVFGRDTTAAVSAFMAANGLSFETTQARDIMLAVDSQYAYFYDTRGGLRSV